MATGAWSMGVIDYDARSEHPVARTSGQSAAIATSSLRLDWRHQETSGPFPMPVVKPDGTEEVDAAGKPIIQVREMRTRAFTCAARASHR
jgi:hypothetical protein